MFGLMERGRLAMYEKTLSTAKRIRTSDAHYIVGMADALSVLQLAMIRASSGPHELEYCDALSHTVSEIPSSLLSDIDQFLIRAIKPPTNSHDEALYYMASLLNGLTYVRIVEVTQPSLRSRAHTFRDAALSFLEPIYHASVVMMLAEAHAMMSSAQEEKLEAERQATIDEAVRVGLAASRRHGI